MKFAWGLRRAFSPIGQVFFDGFLLLTAEGGFKKIYNLYSFQPKDEEKADYHLESNARRLIITRLSNKLST